ncbi:MAG TPA: EF-P beta-lysylation protein EpmB, partial [Gammaproteobacteria bacterium]|nr:EF-P beta-lysylation protein EpmB [Gammaproteobacteria bacterium]
TTADGLLTSLGLDIRHLPEIDNRPDFPIRVPRPFIDRMKRGDPSDPLLRQVLAVSDERHPMPGFTQNPLQELDGPIPGVLHKYRSRVLLIYRGGCAVNCRYCFRRHFPYQNRTLARHDLDDVVRYLEAHSEINEVIFSGGDPLMADDGVLASFFQRLEAISSIRRLRIHTRLPVVIPERVTDTFCQTIASITLPVIVVLHINHANEIDEALINAVSRLRTVCRSILNQSVILGGINDSADDLITLSERLFEAGIDPYYLNVLDRVSGAHHFEVPEEKLQILHQALLDALPGFLVPKLVKEVPGIGHKVLW